MAYEDPSRGGFRVRKRKTQRVMRADKTEQDHMPVKERPRYKAWLTTQNQEA